MTMGEELKRIADALERIADAMTKPTVMIGKTPEYVNTPRSNPHHWTPPEPK